MHKNNRLTTLLRFVYFGLLAAFAPVSTDLYLSSLPTIKVELQTTVFLTQFTLIGFFIMFAFAQLLWGPLSDAIGRKRAIYLGLLTYIVGSLCCLFSDSIGILIVGRLLQAAGGGGGVAICFAIIHDIYKGRNMTKLISRIALVVLIAPMIAPIIGSYLLIHFSWRSNFIFLGLYAVSLLLATGFFHETLPISKRLAFKPTILLQQYIKQCKHRAFIIPTLSAAVLFAGFFSYLTNSSFIYQEFYHLSATAYAHLFAFNALALIIAITLIGIIHKKIHSTAQFLFWTALALTLVLLAALIAIGFQPHSIITLVIALFAVSFGMGLFQPTARALGLEQVVEYAGIASGIFGFIRFMVATIIALLFIHFVTTGIHLVFMMMITSLLAFILLLFNHSPK